MDVSALVLKPNDRCEAFGRLVSVDGSVTFEPPLPRPAIGYPPGGEPAPKPSGLGLAITGIDLGELLDRREKDGAVEGWATVEVIWNNDTLQAVAQRAVRPPVGERPGWTDPPCPPPANGWPSGDDFSLPPELQRELEVAGLVLNMTVFHPQGSGPVLVIATDDPQAAAERLGSLAGSQICVVQSRYSPDEINQVRHQLRERFKEWRCFASGQTSSADGQICFQMSVVRVGHELSSWAKGVSEGLLRVHAWLAPVGAQGV